MPLEHFKTQVLLLHSEQSTLDTLSSGFNDRYTVHCATSGSEALNTLGEVSIHVIVSAQKLPGMSGLDALREAQKRSPETIGILLAADGDGEALVGEKDMFQVIRDEVTPESLRQFIDKATQQARLMALAESANDTLADMDQPTGEHIVMETSENGSTIISDGTGRFPALNPSKVSPQAAVGARAVAVLVLTQDEEFLKTIRESSRGMHEVLHATTISQADEAVAGNKVGVAVIDAAMVGTNVEKMALHLRKTANRLVAIVAGRRDDGEMLMDLINRGKVYRFLLKPVSPGRARLAIEASVKHHLEAPDAAFRLPGGAAATPPPKAAPKPKPAAKPAAGNRPKPGAADGKAGAKAAPGTSPAAKKKQPTPVVARRDEEPANALPEIRVEPRPADASRSTPSALDDGLGDAFGEKSSFTETVTGLFKTIGSERAAEKPAQKTATPAAPDGDASSTPSAASAGSGRLSAPVLGGVAALVVVLAGAGWWLMGGQDSAPDAPAATAADAPPTDPEVTAPATAPQPAGETPPPAPAEPAVDVDALLADARQAQAAGRIFSPAGDNAIELFVAASAELPDNPQLAAELGSVIDTALALAEAALLERRNDDVRTILDTVRLADPGNSRLPFLVAQLDDIEFRDTIADARAAIREQRFDDAAATIETARTLDAADADEVEAVAAELGQALLDQEVGAILADASARLADGALIEPPGDNARHYFELALATDPQNAAAEQGLVAVASRLVLRARADIDAREFAAAEALLEDARSLDPESRELANADRALAAEKEQVELERREAERLAAEKARAEREAAERAEQERLARERAAAEQAERERLAREREAAERAEQERLARERAAAEQAERERLAREREAAERAAAERAAAEKAAAERAAAAAKLAADAQAPPQQAPAARQTRTPAPAPAQREPAPTAQARTSPPPVAEAQAPAEEATPAGSPVEPESAGAAADPAARAAGASAAPAPVVRRPVPVSSLERKKYVAPKYPRAAERRGLSGWVDVLFTVSKDGSVTDIEIVGSEPGDIFVDAATDAVEDWEFEPVTDNGEPVEQRAAVRMMFAIE
ncbi:MAG: TonB family protein [Woeseiaceae bacterium]|nr:TonB family protein [Woeseiaceae bacterium]